ncbi:hypothetical protein [Hymenobacter sp. APR13]|uniref:hypothetical protein n=1 Tax=Hymenobacter sp. APR13 TaxID=1356852 RepID=UPI0012E0B781|nr:hypothetical protein [Hymenobacter sp. APR13]
MAYLFSASDSMHESEREYLKRKGINVISYSDGFEVNEKDVNDKSVNYFSEYVSSIKSDLISYDDEVARLSERGKALYDFLIFLYKYNFFKERLHKESIVDQMFISLNRFADITCVPYKELISLYPFRVKDEENVHGYVLDYTYSIKNPAISRLFYDEIDIRDGVIEFKAETTIAKKKQADMLYKIKWIIKKLNASMITSVIGDGHNLQYPNGYPKLSIELKKEEAIENPLSDYVALKFDKCIASISLMSVSPASKIDDDMELCYMHYKLGNFHQCILMLDEVANKAWQSEKYISYFLAKSNIKTMRNLVKYNIDEDYKHKYELINKIKSFQLDDLVNKLTKIDDEQRDFIIKIRDKYFNRIFENNIDEIIEQINNVFWLYHGGGGVVSGALHHVELEARMMKYFVYLNTNCIIYDAYNEYKRLSQRSVEALLLSLSMTTSYVQKMNEFSSFIILTIIHYCNSDNLVKKMNQLNINSLPVNNKTAKWTVATVKNFLLSNHTVSKTFSYVFANRVTDSQLNNLYFTSIYSSVFNNCLFVLSYIDIEKDDAIDIANNIITFLENISANKRLRLTTGLAGFVDKQGEHLNWEILYNLLRVGSEMSEMRSENFFRSIHRVYVKNNMPEKITDEVVVLNIMNHQKVNRSDKMYLVYLWNMGGDSIKVSLKK